MIQPGIERRSTGHWWTLDPQGQFVLYLHYLTCFIILKSMKCHVFKQSLHTLTDNRFLYCVYFLKEDWPSMFCWNCDNTRKVSAGEKDEKKSVDCHNRKKEEKMVVLNVQDFESLLIASVEYYTPFGKPEIFSLPQPATFSPPTFHSTTSNQY